MLNNSINKYQLSTFCVLLFLLYFLGIGHLITIMSFIYPFYKSIKSLESSYKNNNEQKYGLIMYWIIYSVFCITEIMLDMITNNWIYYILKGIILLYLFDDKNSLHVY